MTKKWDGMSPENVDLKELNLKENDDFGCGRPGFWILKTQFDHILMLMSFLTLIDKSLSFYPFFGKIIQNY